MKRRRLISKIFIITAVLALVLSAILGTMLTGPATQQGQTTSSDINTNSESVTTTGDGALTGL